MNDRHAPGLWLDRGDALERLQRPGVTEEQRRHALELMERGFTILRQANDASVCEAVTRSYLDFCETDSGARDAVVLGRFHNRLINFHMTSNSALLLATNHRILSLLDFLFAADAVVYTSLTFEIGSSQRIHRDGPHFFTQPPNYFFGVWHALEDVHPDAGPLEYFVGGHRIADFSGQDVLRRLGRSRSIQPEDFHAALDSYDVLVTESCEAAGLRRETAILERGDVLIWHPLLPHGGSSVANADLTRRSMVVHCVPRGVPVYNAEFFFDPVKKLPAREYRYVEQHGRGVLESAPAYFQTTYLEPK